MGFHCDLVDSCKGNFLLLVDDLVVLPLEEIADLLRPRQNDVVNLPKN